MPDRQPPEIQIREPLAGEASWIDEQGIELGGPVVVSAGRLRDLRTHPSRIALIDEEPVGFIVFREEPDAIEVLALKTVRESSGVGSALMAWLDRRARALGLDRLWLCTTNDNLRAFGFYQKCGYRVCEYRAGGFDEVLRLKGLDRSQTVVGKGGLAIRDVIVLEKRLSVG